MSDVNVSYLISIKCSKIIPNFKELKIKNKTKSLRNQTFSESKNLNLFKCKKYVMQLISYNVSLMLKIWKYIVNSAIMEYYLHFDLYVNIKKRGALKVSKI